MSVTINADGAVTIGRPRDRVPPGNTAARGSLRELAAAAFDALDGQVGDLFTTSAAMPRALHVDVTVAVDRRILWPWRRAAIERRALAAVRPVAAAAGYSVTVRVLERWRCRSTR